MCEGTGNSEWRGVGAEQSFSLFNSTTAELVKIMKRNVTAYMIGILLLSAVGASAQLAWQEKLRRELPLLGHRNWIVIADSAYPLQTAPGIETVYVDGDQLEVTTAVLAELAKVKHVRPVIFTDAELKFVPEKNAPGIAEYRAGLEKVLAGKAAQALPHEQIIGRLDEAGKTFKVLLFKTKLTLPYTSVFLQLDCGYWSAEAEKELRDAMRK